MQTLSHALLEQGWLNTKQWQTVVQDADAGIIAYLAEKELVPSQVLADVVAAHYQKKLINLDTIELIACDLPLKLLKKIMAVPFKNDAYLHVALADPANVEGISELQFLSEKPIKTYVGDYFIIKKRLKKMEQTQHEHNIQKPADKNGGDKHAENDEPLIQLLNAIFQEAIEKNATEIHIETYDNQHRIRYRIDGMLAQISSPPSHITERLKTRIKIMSQLDIANTRLPQDGYCQLGSTHARVSTCPGIYGEKIVLRLLPREKTWNVGELGMTAKQEQLFIQAVEKPQGLVLVTGPTGSGKTVTLYAAIQHLSTEQRNICTVEDPVEIRLKGVNQVNINSQVALNFPKVLRAFLRQDPDIIMIGEIRDAETAKIAMRASQTGHLVLATLHANSAIDAINRLRSFGVPPYEIASQISLITAQRLLRHKKDNGYQGRFAIHELLAIDETISNAILHQKSIVSMLNKLNFCSLKQSANFALKNNLTTQAEVDRVLG